MASSAQVGLFIPLTIKASGVDIGHDFIHARHAHVKTSEPHTLQWFALQVTDTQRYVIFNTFANQTGRQAHMDNVLAAGLMDKRKMALAEGDEGLQVKPVDLLVNKVTYPSGAAGATQGLKCGVRVLLTAKEDRVEAVKQHFRILGPGILSQPDPPVWFAFWLPGTTQFGIISLFSSEEERETRLASQAADARRANADNLALPPDIAMVDVVAAKF